jgi:hypothetical protein
MRFLSLLLLLIFLSSRAYAANSGYSEQPTEWVRLAPASERFVDAEMAARAEEAIAGKLKGKPFTRKQKETVKQQNAEENGGQNRCENCNTETIPAEKHVKGVTPPLNETHVDHVIPQAKGGKSETDNGQVLCRDCNIKKSDKLPKQEPEK